MLCEIFFIALLGYGSRCLRRGFTIQKSPLQTEKAFGNFAFYAPVVGAGKVNVPLFPTLAVAVE